LSLGINSVQYIICHCLGNSPGNNAYVSDATVSTNAFEFAGDLYKCNYNLTYDLHRNFGFWTFVVVHLILLAVALIMSLISYPKMMINNNMNAVKEYNLRTGQDRSVGDNNNLNVPDKEKQAGSSAFTKFDFEEMSLTHDIMQKDTRTFCGFFCDTLRRHNYLLSPFLSSSLIKPFWVRTFELLSWLTFVGFFNCFFYWDKYIFARQNNNVTWSAMGQVFSKELDKSFFSVLATYPFMLLLGYCLRTPRSKQISLNEAIQTGNQESILKEYHNYNKSVMIQRVIVWLVFSTILAFFTYYIVLYNAFYITNSLYWFIGFMVSSIAMLIVVQPIISLLYSVSWVLSKKNRFLVCIFSLFRFLFAY